MRLLAGLVFFSALAISPGFTARILAYFPVSAPSHHFFYQPFLVELAKRGHQIDYYSPIPLSIPQANITLYSIRNTSSLEAIGPSPFHQWKLPILRQISNILDLSVKVDKKLCQTQNVRNLLSSDVKYDLILQEDLLNYESGSVFKHKFNAPSVSLLSVGDLYQTTELSGLTANPSHMVHVLTESTDRMGFFERIYNTYVWIGTLYLYFMYLRRIQTNVDTCYTYPGWELRPPIEQLLSEQALILTNSHPSVGFAYPTAPHVKEIGGAVISSRKQLPKNIEDFINGAKHGVIYFSLGSILCSEKEVLQYREIFSRAFAERKERILWKWNFEPWDDIPSNTMISDWFPQQDILAHQNIKLFITHGGMQSFIETVNFGVPVIVIPSFADQIKNSLSMVQRGYGVTLRWTNVTHSSLNWALNEVLDSPKYKRQVLKGSAILNDRPMSSVNEGVYWIEYVLRHGDVLRSEGSRMSFIQLHCLDIYGLVFVTLLAIFYSVRTITSWLCCRYKRRCLN